MNTIDTNEVYKLNANAREGDGKARAELKKIAGLMQRGELDLVGDNGFERDGAVEVLSEHGYIPPGTRAWIEFR